MDKVLLQSENMNWKTPTDLYNFLDSLFGFDFDPCPISPTFDGLSIEWGQSNYVNPPYGTAIKHWVKKAYEEYLKNKRVVLLIPSRTDTRYWHDYIMRASEIWFIRGRVKFEGAKHNAPFPSAIILFEPKCRGHLGLKSVNINDLGGKDKSQGGNNVRQ